jgi:hypothetical protein
MNSNIIIKGLYIELVGLYRAREYEAYGGSHCPNFSKWLMCGRIKSVPLICNGYFAN